MDNLIVCINARNYAKTIFTLTNPLISHTEKINNPKNKKVSAIVEFNNLT